MERYVAQYAHTAVWCTVVEDVRTFVQYRSDEQDFITANLNRIFARDDELKAACDVAA